MHDDPARLALATLVHDVGKHVARTARNVTGGVVPAPLLPLLLSDLYRLDGSRRASEVFSSLRAAVGPAHVQELDAVSALLAEADSIEVEVRRGEPDSVSRAVTIARDVERRLRSLVVESGGGGT